MGSNPSFMRANSAFISWRMPSLASVLCESEAAEAEDRAGSQFRLWYGFSRAMDRSSASLHSLGCRVKGSGNCLCRIRFQRTALEAQTQRQFQVFHAT
jgi:hypothetical protein